MKTKTQIVDEIEALIAEKQIAEKQLRGMVKENYPIDQKKNKALYIKIKAEKIETLEWVLS